ncbi:hypothetical protein ACQP3L_37275 [Escherichia coli]
MEGLTLPGEQKEYGIGRVLVGGLVWEEGKQRQLGLTYKTILFLIQIKKQKEKRKKRYKTTQHEALYM